MCLVSSSGPLVQKHKHNTYGAEKEITFISLTALNRPSSLRGKVLPTSKQADDRQTLTNTYIHLLLAHIYKYIYICL